MNLGASTSWNLKTRLTAAFMKFLGPLIENGDPMGKVRVEI